MTNANASDARRRMGIFRVHADIILQYPIPEGLKKLFSEVVVTRCEFLAHGNTFEYVGFSGLFKEVSEGEILPEYLWHVQEKPDSLDNPKVVKVFPEETENTGICLRRTESV